MKFLRLMTWVSAPLAWLSACHHQVPLSGLQDASAVGSDSADQAVLQVGTAGSNLPPVGRSTFDFLIASQSSDPMNPVVPYPFEKLVATIAASGGVDLGAVLIPRGRSLQKEAAAPDYFKFPRIVVAASPQPKDLDAPAPAIDVGGKLFVGYVEPAKKMEVISYNEAAGRFEFQIVEDYDAPPAIPKVYYADRGLCLTCHQGQGPIFPKAPWNETSANFPIRDAIASTMGMALGNFEYHGVSFGTTDGVVGGINGAALIDTSVRTANSYVIRNALWIDACGKSGGEGVLCRSARLREAMVDAFVDVNGFISNYTSQDADSAVIANTFNQKTALYYPNGLRLPSSVLPPLPIGGALSIAEVIALTTGIQAQNALNPVVRRQLLEAVEVDQNSGLPHQNFEGFDLRSIAKAFGPDFTKISDAIETLAARTNAGTSDVLAGKPFRRSVVLNDLLKLAGADVPEHLCCGIESAVMPPPLEAPLPPNVGAGGDPRLVPFKQFCTPCHSAPPLPPFLSGSDTDVMAAIAADGRPQDIFDRLNWESNPPPDSPMPPLGSNQNNSLRMPENAAKRVQMQVLMQELLSPSN